ncbi:MAG: alcohol dehydrogenase catalytic domain-containing protein [Clostridiales bacterium]|jgi:2-desacetyl-2-hydroxyethyl bacteriochlorophyllide A dehydrogenase|nr:alcohol dehydrogenase catalytic domain-containing protein [Clostridiales bacterium]
MKGILYEGAGAVNVRELAEPAPRAGWALIKVSHAGICGSDLNIYAGTHPRAKAPLVMGHEFSGRLMEDAGGLKKGAFVTVNPLLSCGECQPCRTGNSHVCDTLKLVGIDCDGGMAEYAAAPSSMLVPLPEGVGGKLGALVEPVAVAVHAIREQGFVPGDNALVFGCGPIGLVVALTLRLFGAASVTMAEVDQKRADAARGMGFLVVNPAETDMEKFAKEQTLGVGFDWVFDCAGVQKVADALLDVVRVRGVIVIVASYKHACTMPFFKGMVKETSIRFVRVYRPKDFRIAAGVISKLPEYEKIITHVLPAEEARRGFELATTPGSGAVKVMYRFD